MTGRPGNPQVPGSSPGRGAKNQRVALFRAMLRLRNTAQTLQVGLQPHCLFRNPPPVRQHDGVAGWTSTEPRWQWASRRAPITMKDDQGGERAAARIFDPRSRLQLRFELRRIDQESRDDRAIRLVPKDPALIS